MPIKNIAAGIACVVLSTHAVAQANKVSIYGVGGHSCARWLSNKQNEEHGRTWILAFWSGINAGQERRGASGIVGNKTDGHGILAFVKKKCAEDPALNLAVLVRDVYTQFEREGR